MQKSQNLQLRILFPWESEAGELIDQKKLDYHDTGNVTNE